MLGDRVAELARVLPSVSPGDATPAPALQDERYRAHRAVRALLEQLAAAAPVVILLDDLQWADDSSLELVAHLLRRPPRAQLLLAAAYRAGGLAPSVLAAFEAAGRDRRVVDVALAPLTADEADALLGDLVPARVRPELYRLSGGNPFYLAGARARRRAARGLRRRAGRRRQRPGARGRRARAGDRRALRPGARPAARRGGGRRPGGARRSPRRPAGSPTPARRSTSCVASRLVAAAALPRRYRFRHPIVRAAAYESAGAGWRLGAHARAAAALAAAGGSPRRARAPPRALCRAGRRRRRSACSRRPATRRRPARPRRRRAGTRRRCACSPPRTARRLELLAPLATALASTGQLERALATLLEVLAVVPPEFAELRAKLVAACAGCENLLGRHGDAHDRLERALADLPDGNPVAAGDARGGARRRRALRLRLRGARGRARPARAPAPTPPATPGSSR